MLHIFTHHDSLSQRVDRKSHCAAETMSNSIQLYTYTPVPPSLIASRLVGNKGGGGCCEDMQNMRVWWGSLCASVVGGEQEVGVWGGT